MISQKFLLVLSLYIVAGTKHYVESLTDFPKTLKMLGLYLDTLIVGHKFCSMLSILNVVTSQKELQNFMTIFLRIR